MDDFQFDDEKWAVRYIVVDTGGWLGRRVLISPISFSRTDWDAKAIDLSLTRDRIRDSPAADLGSPITRQYELGYFGYYGYPPYWVGPEYWGAGPYPGTLTDARPTPTGDDARAAAGEARAASRVRSSRHLRGYHIHATDGEIGHVDDFIIDDETWAIRYLRIDTSNWIGGKAVLVPRRALREIDWAESRINVALTKEQIRNSPEYDPGLLNREYEQRLEAYYR